MKNITIIMFKKYHRKLILKYEQRIQLFHSYYVFYLKGKA